MQAETAPLRPRYRNDAVFRSAERLLATRPKKPADKRPPRWIVFLAGLICGSGIVLLILWPTLTIVPQEKTSPASARATAKAGFARPARSPATTNPLPQKSREVVAEIVPAVTDIAEPSAEPRRGAVAVAIPPASSARRPTPPSPATTNSLRFASALRLRGKQVSRDAPPVEVEFALFVVRGSRGASVHGSVRYFDEVNLVSFHRLHGSLSHDVIIVSEPTRHSRTAPPTGGRMFAIELPEDPNATEITGTWAHGPRRGTLALKSVVVAP